MRLHTCTTRHFNVVDNHSVRCDVLLCHVPSHVFIIRLVSSAESVYLSLLYL